MDLAAIYDTAYNNLVQTSLVEFFAVIFGLLSVWFARKENIWTYPTGIINVLIYVYLCYHAGLYADMGINAFYFVMSVYGWYNWARKIDTTKHVPITKLSLREWILYLLAVALFYFVIRYILRNFTNSTVPDLDSFTTSLFIIGMWWMAIKKVENWIAWIIGDVMVIPLFAYKGLAFTSVQYLVFLALAIAGYIEWRKKLLAHEQH